jgi:hypothetical protein
LSDELIELNDRLPDGGETDPRIERPHLTHDAEVEEVQEVVCSGRPPLIEAGAPIWKVVSRVGAEDECSGVGLLSARRVSSPPPFRNEEGG